MIATLPGWFSIKGAAIYTGFSIPTIRKALGNGLPASRMKITADSAQEMIRIRREDLDGWIQKGGAL
jgi:hypothetical protein